MNSTVVMPLNVYSHYSIEWRCDDFIIAHQYYIKY